MPLTRATGRCLFATLLLSQCFSRNAALRNVDYQPPEVGCDLYLAESTIPGAGLGIFSAIEKDVGDSIGNGDVCILLMEMQWHNDGTNWFFLMADYIWDGQVMGMQQEVAADDIAAYWPGIDCAVNCHLALLNVEKATPRYDEGGLHRGHHPGAGAISPYHNGTTKVSRKIPAGGELFKYYGDTWFTTRQDTFGNIPLYDNWGKALYVLKRVATITEEPHVRKATYNLLLEMKSLWDSRTLNALPDSWNEAVQAINADDMGVLFQPQSTRSIEWLKENGKCVDHILPGNSTIQGAGHGGFAKRDLPAGTIITASPLHHVPDRRVINIYDVEETEDGTEVRSDSVLGHQVLLNYCFGHPESSLLLCPYGSGVGYINHNKTLANVKLEWARHGSTSHNQTWLNMPPDEMEWQYQTNLAIEFVATRDIAQGEELFLDYGDDWEQAWLAHVENWDDSQHAMDYMSATQYNNLFGKEPLRTTEEQERDPYPENIVIHCHKYLMKKKYKEDKDPKHFEWKNHDKGNPCQILQRHSEDDTYDVSIQYKGKDVTRARIHRRALSFVDAPYSTDMHLLSAFRHHLGLPEDLMPEAWKNL